MTLDTFKAEVEAFLDRTGMSATAFGKAALSDPSFVLELRARRAPNLKTVERVCAFMAEHEAPAERVA